MEDAILDCLISVAVDPDKPKINDAEDAKLFTRQQLFGPPRKEGVKQTEGWIIENSVAIATGIQTRLAMKLIMFLSGETLKEDSALAGLLKKTVRIRERKLPIGLLSNPNNTPFLTVSIPALGDKDEAGTQSLAHLLQFARCMLGVPLTSLKVRKDNELGSKVMLPTQINKGLDALTLAALSPKGSFAGTRHKFENGFEANLPECIGALRMLNDNSVYLRRKAPPKQSPEKKSPAPGPVTAQDLREAILMLGGFKAPNLQNTYGVQVVKWVFNTMSSTACRNFPGGFKYSVKASNQCKSNQALFSKMGYDMIVPIGAALISVFSTGVRMDKDDPKKEIFVRSCQGRRWP
jgi:hypothetical protein